MGRSARNTSSASPASRRPGTAWVVSLGSEILRFTADGQELPALPVKARAIAISPTTGQVWATTETEILQTRRGRPAKDGLSLRIQVRAVLAGRFLAESSSKSREKKDPRNKRSPK